MTIIKVLRKENTIIKVSRWMRMMWWRTLELSSSSRGKSKKSTRYQSQTSSTPSLDSRSHPSWISSAVVNQMTRKSKANPNKLQNSLRINSILSIQKIINLTLRQNTLRTSSLILSPLINKIKIKISKKSRIASRKIKKRKIQVSKKKISKITATDKNTNTPKRIHK
jgi:hypothetical protein